MIKVDRAKLVEMAGKFNEAGLVKAKIEFTDETPDKELVNSFLNAIDKVPKAKEKSIPKDVAVFYNEIVDAIEAEEDAAAQKFAEEKKTMTSKDKKKAAAKDKKAPEETKAKAAPAKAAPAKAAPAKDKKKGESGPSSKLILYKEFQKGKKSIDDLEKVAEGSVKRSTIRMWVSRWSRKVGIPKGASK